MIPFLSALPSVFASKVAYSFAKHLGAPDTLAFGLGTTVAAGVSIAMLDPAGGVIVNTSAHIISHGVTHAASHGVTHAASHGVTHAASHGASHLNFFGLEKFFHNNLDPFISSCVNSCVDTTLTNTALAVFSPTIQAGVSDCLIHISHSLIINGIPSTVCEGITMSLLDLIGTDYVKTELLKAETSLDVYKKLRLLFKDPKLQTEFLEILKQRFSLRQIPKSLFLAAINDGFNYLIDKVDNKIECPRIQHSYVMRDNPSTKLHKYGIKVSG